MRALLLIPICLWACDDGGQSDPDAAALDAARLVDAAIDAAPAPADATPLDLSIVDAAEDAAAGDAGPPPRCSAPPATPFAPVGPVPPPASPHRGVDAWEAPAYARLRDAALADPGVHFVATWSHADEALVVERGAAEARTRLVFRRLDDGSMEILEGAVADVFPETRVDLYGTLPALLERFEHADAPDYTARGYALEDPRVGWLGADDQSWPEPLLRLATLFDAPDAPDLVAGLWPWAYPAVSTHGGMGLLQSRSSLIISGRGARQGVVLDDVAWLVDAAPTALAALGAPTTGGVGPDGLYDDGLYLARQDGRALWEALDPDPCVRPRHVVMVLFDGLLATELNHQALAEAPDVDLPTFRALAAGGAVYRYGAVAGYPSVSAPGHMTAGTGLWPGHHGIVGNAFFDRAGQRALNPFSFLQDPVGFLQNPEQLWEFYDRAVAEGTETLAAAAHRALGRWDPETGEGAYVVVLNEIAIGDADMTTLDRLGGAPKASLAQYRVADNLGIVQAEQVIGARDTPVPTILQMSFVSTDGAGEADGPHSPLVREILTEMDARMARLVAALDRVGALEETMFILVSDHGMEMQDPTRSTNIGGLVQGSGVRLSYQGSGLFYLRTLEVEVARVDDELTVTVRNHDQGAPVAGATVSCEGCVEAMTDAEGVAQMSAAAGVELVITHPQFNPQRLPTP